LNGLMRDAGSNEGEPPGFFASERLRPQQWGLPPSWNAPYQTDDG
jgi:hypothetical protein